MPNAYLSVATCLLMQLEHDVHLNVDNSNFTTLVFTLCARRHVLKLSYARANRSSMLLPPHHFW